MKPTVCKYRRFYEVILSLIQIEVGLTAVNGARQATIITSPKLKVRMQREDDNMLLGFESTRSGIREEFKDKIIQHFFTIKRETESTGLGLYIAYYIVTAYAGSLKVFTKPNEDIRFTIKFEWCVNDELYKGKAF